MVAGRWLYAVQGILVRKANQEVLKATAVAWYYCTLYRRPLEDTSLAGWAKASAGQCCCIS